MEEVEKQKSQVFFYVNAAVQLTAIFAFQQFGIVWMLYITIALLSIVVIFQTLSAAVIFSSIIQVPKNDKKTSSRGIGILISILYMISCYHIYQLGFVGFAWVAAAHVVIQFFANIFGAFK